MVERRAKENMKIYCRSYLKEICVILILVFLISTSSNAFASSKKINEPEQECRKYKYGQRVFSNIGRPGRIIKCRSLLPNPIYGYGIEVRWDDDLTGETTWVYLEDVNSGNLCGVDTDENFL